MDSLFIMLFCALAILLASRFAAIGEKAARAARMLEYAIAAAILSCCLMLLPFLWQGALCAAAAALALSKEKRIAVIAPAIAALSASPYGTLLCTALFMLSYEGRLAAISLGIPLAYAASASLSTGAFLLEDFGSSFIYLIALAAFLAAAGLAVLSKGKLAEIMKSAQARLPFSPGSFLRRPS